MQSPSDCTVLIVDDTEANIDILVETLGDDYKLSVAMDGENALETAAENPPDLILLDIMMPGMDGYEVCRRLKADQELNTIPVIFVTAMGEVTDETKGLELGAIDYIRKPFNPPIVKARVKNHLELKLAQEGLKKQNAILNENLRLREEVENITRHDLKSPLNAFLNTPKLMIQDGGLSDEHVELLQMMSKSAYYMLEIINKSLDLYKLEIGDYQPRLVPVDLIKLLDQIRGETQGMTRAKKLKLNVSLNGKPAGAGDEFLVAGEEMLCYSMFANLIKNAMEASPEGEEIKVGLRNPAFPLVEIHNLGVVPEGIRSRFFEKYVTSGKEGGTGLGTYSAALIAKTLGGNIDFDSSEASGTTLRVELTRPDEDAVKATKESLPLAKPATPLPGPASTTIPLSAQKILIADDQKIMRQMIINILKQMGFSSFREAEDGLHARDILTSFKIDLVISDINMPKMNGIELLDFVRGTRDLLNLPFIIVSAESDEERVLEAAKKKVAGYVLKPFTPNLLKEKIEKLFPGLAL